jgi:lantibiotic modifying enzyme
MGGTAGAIGATLHLDRHYGTHELSALAVACGDELCRKAAWDGERCSWACKEANGTDFQGIPLAGLSHGSAGFALALLELFRVTGEDRFLAAANGALAYENGMFDTDRGWVDARSPFTRRIPGGIDGTFMTAWCHGAGGIALVRLRAAAIDCSRSDAHAGWARLALEFVKSAVDAALDAERFDASLCHGVLGLSEVFYTAGQLTGNEEYKQIGRATAARLVGRIRKTQD